jgi:hypothetical protein
MRQYSDKWMFWCQYTVDLFLAKGPGRALATQHWRASNELKPKWGMGWLSLYRRWFFCRLLLLALLWSADRLFPLQLPGDDLARG